MKILALLTMSLFLTEQSSATGYPDCQELLVERAALAQHVKAPTVIPFNFPGLKIASLTDPTLSTGATLFHFAEGAEAVFDARGGSVAASETTLLEDGSYSHNIDGIFFAGGSTMGLAVGDGVRRKIFNERSHNAGAFDFIPSVPGAVVYDYGGRIAPFNEPLRFPDSAMGEKLFDNLSADKFYAGRFGAGVTTTFGKIASPFWGGQGMAQGKLGRYHILCAVVLNASGNIFNKDGQMIGKQLLPPGRALTPPSGGRQNTTLSLVVTDAPLDQNELKRLAVMVHSSMAAWIRPFHTSVDGDILFAVSTAKNSGADKPADLDLNVGMKAQDIMAQAITTSIEAANQAR